MSLSNNAQFSNSELWRVSTFIKWPDDASIRPFSLARSGFYFIGPPDKTRCFACQLEVDNWKSGDNPAEVHRHRSPRCQFITSLTENLESAEGTTQLPVPHNLGTEVDGGCASRPRHGIIPSNAVTKTNNLGTNTSSSSNFRQTSTASHSAASLASVVGLSAVASAPAIDRNNPDFTRLRSESIRLETFHDWPSTAGRVVDPRDLVTAGLFYTGHTDRVQCAFCRGYLRNWTPGDKPIDEHRKHFPDCPFLRDISNVNNVSTQFVRAQNVSDISNVSLSNSTAPSGDDNNVSRQPKHPQFSQLSVRIQSFSRGKVSVGQTAEGLAAAGFYYVGPDDNVRCFWCNGGLKNFQSTDNPQTEHTRWFPRCGFVQQSSTKHFTDTTRQPLNPMAAQQNNTATETVTQDECVNAAAAAANINSCSEARIHTDGQYTSSDLESGTLLEENKQLKDARTCKVCMDAEVDTVFLPCGHLVCCSNCSPSLRNCAICRALIRGTVKTFLSD